MFNITRIDTDETGTTMFVDIYLENQYIEEFYLPRDYATFSIYSEYQSTPPQATTWTNIVAFVPGSISSNVLSFAGSSPQVAAFCSNDVSSEVLFSSTLGFQAGYTGLNLKLNSYNSSGGFLSSFSNTINVLPGRFVFPGGTSNFNFYKNETITPVTIQSGLFLTSVPTTFPALPSGLYFDGSGNSFTIRGTPIVQTPNQTYQFIGNNSNTGQSISVPNVTIKVNGERSYVTPATAFLDLTTGITVQPISFTATVPNGSYGLQFGWASLPDGLYFQDSDSEQIYGNTTSSNPIFLTGSPTIDAARQGQNGSFTLLERAYGRTGNSLSSSSLISYSFSETILISNVTALNLFKDVSMSFQMSAATYYPSGSPIVVFQATSGLPTGLTFSYTDYSGIGTLSGTPTTYDVSDSYTFTAINSNGLYQSISFPIYVAPNNIIFSQPAFDASYVLVIGRPLDRPITGYFSYPIQFAATASSGCNVVYESRFDLSPYGISLSSNGLLSGTPTTALSTTNVGITGIDSVFQSLGSTEIILQVIPDIFTFNTRTFTFNQNTAIPPFTVFASTFGEQQIQSYGYTSLPAGLTLNAAGFLTGTPTTPGSGNIIATATTAFSTGSGTYPYTILADQLLLTTPSNSYSLKTGIPSIQVTGTAYSGSAITNYRLTGTTYGFTITSNGLIGGTLSGTTFTHTPLTITAAAGGVDITSQLLLEGTSPNVSLYVIGGYGAPVFSAPTKLQYQWYLYVPIVPITVVASGSPYYFALSDNLPLGITFNASTGVLSGTPARLSSGQSIQIYAKNATAVSVLVVTVSVFQPFVARHQFSAGSYTAVVRETTLINAAQNAINNEVVPSTETTLGGLMAPRPPDVKTAKDPCCN